MIILKIHFQESLRILENLGESWRILENLPEKNGHEMDQERLPKLDPQWFPLWIGRPFRAEAKILKRASMNSVGCENRHPDGDGSAGWGVRS